MLGIGEELKNKREEKGLSIYDVENQTKIKASFIEAIESENFDKIPGRVYVKGFIKNYAKFLELDHTLYLQRVNQLFQDEGFLQEDILANSKPQLVRPAREKKPYRKILQGLLILLLLVGLSFGVYKAYNFFKADGADILLEDDKNLDSSQDEKSDPSQAGEQSNPQNEPESEPEPEPPQQSQTQPQSQQEPQTEPKVQPVEPAKTEPVEKKIKLEIIMSDGGPGKDSCWIQVIADGKLEFEQTIMAGREPLVFTAAESIDFTYGNAAAIQVKINGQDQGYLGESGQVDTKRIRAD